MKPENLFVCLFLLILGSGCTKEEPNNSILYEVILENYLSYSEEEKIPEQYLVFKNETDWNNFIPEIERVNPSQAEHFKVLDFDFDKNNLIIIIGKYYNYCCSRISVHGIYNKNGIAVVLLFL